MSRSASSSPLPSTSPSPMPKLDHFLICGLGSLGQQCVVALKAFGAIVHGIERTPPSAWEISHLPDLLETLVVGDFCQLNVLEQGRVGECRSVLIVSGNEVANVEAAFAVRQLNPQARLVVRSAKENLNRLLEEHLGNFVAFEPTQLPVSTFALSALGQETLGFFQLEGESLQVFQRQIRPGDRWVGFPVTELNTRTRRVLGQVRQGVPAIAPFHQWNPQARLQPGDTMIYIEVTQGFVKSEAEALAQAQRQQQPLWQRLLQQLTWENLRQGWQQFWHSRGKYQSGRLVFMSLVTLALLLLMSMVLFRLYFPNLSLRDAFNTTMILLLGDYSELFGQIPLELPVSWGMQVFSLLLTLAGTAFVGVLYALLTETLLSARFQFAVQRPPVPTQGHVVLVGLGPVGQQVALTLEQLGQPLVGVTHELQDQRLLPHLPLVTGDLRTAAEHAHLGTARSIIAVTDDEMVNLEVGLMARSNNPQGNLVLQTFHQRFTDYLVHLLPYATILCANALAAEAFAAAAFGENVLSLFHLNQATILVTEYQIEAIDTLHDLLLATVAYGYGVVPILYQKHGSSSVRLMPPDDIRLHVGDRMVVLATSHQLQRIERGELAPRTTQVRIERAFTPGAIFDGANTIFRLTDCDLSTARALMNQLPQMIPTPLYQHQAAQLVRELNRIQVQSQVITLPVSTS